MKILLITTTDIIKAAHSRPHQLVEYLSGQHQITVMCINAWWLVDKEGNQLYTHSYNENVKIIYFQDKKNSPVAQEISASIKFLTSKTIGGFDVLINMDSLTAGYFASRHARKEGMLTIFDVDDDLPEMIKTSMNVSIFLKYPGYIVGKYFIGLNIRSFDFITYTVRSLKEAYSIPESKSQRVPNGVNPLIFCNSNEDIRKKFRLENYFVIGYIGVLREWVDLEPAYKALAELEGARLLIVGGEGALDNNIALSDKYGVKDKVIFTGTVPYSSVPAYISAMDVCLIPFKNNEVTRNALPLKLLEYMISSKPVISTPLDGVKEAAGDIVLYADGSEDIVKSVNLLTNNKELISTLGESGNKLVNQQYCWNSIWQRFEKRVIDLKNGKTLKTINTV